MSKRKTKQPHAGKAQATNPYSAKPADLPSTVPRRTIKWLATTFVFVVLGVLLFYFVPGVRKAEHPISPVTPAPVSAHFVGGNQCAGCHEAEAKAWRGSFHDLAMQAPGPDTVLGNFKNQHFRGDGMDVAFTQRDGKYWINAEGPDGKPGDFDVKYVFGVSPLQQYLLELPGGKLQAFTVAWDSRPQAQGGQRWFHLYPGQKFSHNDEMHWTGPQQNWNFMCADCHSTNLQKNYNAARPRFSTSWSEINVGCEACHGPGSAHLEWAATGGKSTLPEKGLTVTLDERKGVTWSHDTQSGQPVRNSLLKDGREVQVCAQCHAQRAQIAEGYHAGQPLLDHYLPSLPTEPFYFADGQQRDEVYTWGSFKQSRMHAKGVTCSDCHDPHSSKLRKPGNAVCLQCHTPAKYDSASHHFHKPAGKGSLCVSCHMPDRLYMVIDNRHDHGFRVPRPDISANYGADKAPNACNNCHQDKNALWAADAVAKWYGPHRRNEQSFGAMLAAASRLDSDKIKGLLALVDNPDIPPIARATALQTIASQPVAATLQVVRNHAGDHDELTRLVATEAAANLPPADRLNVLAPLLRDARLAIRLAAVSGLLDVTRASFSPAQLSDLEAAIAEYRRVQAYNADRAEGQANLGQLEARLGNTAAATTAYESSIRLNPAFVPAYVNLADLQAANGREDDAEKTLRHALALDPKNAVVHHTLGLSLVRAKRLNEALPLLRSAAILSPQTARYAYVYAIALYEPGNARRAIEVLKSAAERHPANVDILSALMNYSALSGDNASAKEYATRLKEVGAVD